METEEWRFSAISISKHQTLINDSGWYYYGHVDIKVSYAEYFAVESSYAAAVKKIFESAGVSEVELMIDCKLQLNDKMSAPFYKAFDQVDSGLKTAVSSNLLAYFVRLALRELIRGLIRSSCGNYTFRFGYDMYMYLNSEKSLHFVTEIAEGEGLVVRA